MIEETADAKPVLNLDEAPTRKPVILASYGGDDNGLPGVRRTTALSRSSASLGIDDDSDVDLHEEDDGKPGRACSSPPAWRGWRPTASSSRPRASTSPA